MWGCIENIEWNLAVSIEFDICVSSITEGKHLVPIISSALDLDLVIGNDVAIVGWLIPLDLEVTCYIVIGGNYTCNCTWHC